jgi:hypothetical protein
MHHATIDAVRSLRLHLKKRCVDSLSLLESGSQDGYGIRPLSVHFAAAQSAKLALVGCAHCGARHTVQRMAAQIEMRHILEQKLAEFENLHILDGVSR